MKEQIPELRIQFTKRADGAVVLRCIRRDGSATWQRHERHAAFFSFHDLSHFAVETCLGLTQGFYGLLAEGWDLRDTDGKGSRGKLPPEAMLVEHLVGLFDREGSGGAGPLSAAEFNAHLRQVPGTIDIAAGFAYSDAQLASVRQRMMTLHTEWIALPAGSTLELAFDRTRRAVSED